MEKYLRDATWMHAFKDFNLYKYPTVLKKGRITHYLIGLDDYILQNDRLQEVLSHLYNTVSGDARRYVDNTAEFALWLKKQRPNNPWPQPSTRNIEK